MRGLALAALLMVLAGAAAGDPLAGRALYQARCAGCHGADGGGGREGGIPVPPVSLAALARPRVIAPARPGYAPAAILRAVTAGVDAADRSLARAMPRFALNAPDGEALVDYLSIIGTSHDPQPGVGARDLRIGALLPLHGAAAASGRAVRSAVEAAFDAAGPIYGRTITLEVADAGDDVAEAYARLAAGDRVCALVATLLPPADTVTLPVVGPLDPSVAATPSVFAIQASTDDQLRALIDTLAQDHPALRLATGGRGWTPGLAAALRADGGSLSDAAHADALLLLPGADPSGAVAALPASAPIAQRLADAVPPGVPESRLVLVAPLLPGDGAALGTGAATLLIEALKRAGAQPTREKLIAALESLRDIPLAGLPPQSFSRTRHVGTRASLVLTAGKPGRARWREPDKTEAAGE